MMVIRKEQKMSFLSERCSWPMGAVGGARCLSGKTKGP